ncbi:MarR family transcriptional regulator [Actinocorallia aurea]
MDDEQGMRLVHGLRALTVKLDLLAGAFAQRQGLHPTDLRALILLLDAARAGEPATPGSLGRGLGLNSAGTTALIDRLERLGHVRRARDPDDRRRVLLEVSDEAAALGWAFFGPLITEMVTALRAFSASDRAAIERFLATAADIVARRPEQGPSR